jgi:hypothetical protein
MKPRTELSRRAATQKISILRWLGLLVIPFLALMPSPISAADINGAWATDTAYCRKVFVKKGNEVTFTDDADLYGGAFIIEGNRASGTFEKCKIKSMKDDGTTVHLIAACSDGIVIQEGRFTVKVVGTDKITLVIEGVETEANPYVRCRL